VEVVGIAGGVGAAKLLVGLQRLVGDRLAAIVNTGDDAEIYGLHVAPDVDIVTYWLSGIADTERGWGIAGDRFAVLEALGSLGEETWFRLGDRDLATCLYRTKLLQSGHPLSAVTKRIARSLGVSARVVPMSDDAVRTRLVTTDGRTLDFQEYFVREQTLPEVAEVHYIGAQDASPSPEVLEAIASASRVVVCPSNPMLSVGPVLAVPGIRDALARHPLVIAVSPIVHGAALKGPADRILKSMGYEPSAVTVASLYADFVDVFVHDSSDAALGPEIEELGILAVALDTMMDDHGASERLAKELLKL
jgi:LPPG:FO 2-phospho-L-lactate transferase